MSAREKVDAAIAKFRKRRRQPDLEAKVSDAQIGAVEQVLGLSSEDLVHRIDVHYGSGSSTIRSAQLGLYVDVLLKEDVSPAAVSNMLSAKGGFPQCTSPEDWYSETDIRGVKVRFYYSDYWFDLSG